MDGKTSKCRHTVCNVVYITTWPLGTNVDVQDIQSVIDRRGRSDG